MPMRAMVMDAGAVDDEVTIDVTGDGVFMSFTLE